MRFLSIFSGIEAASVAWSPLGWQAVAFAEIEPFPSSVLAHHYPHVPNLGDVTQITDSRIAALGQIDLVVGGSPCQDLSVAGKREGLSGERSSLFHEQIRIFHAARNFCGARWLLWENVHGAFSSNSGRDFASVVGAMAGSRIAIPEVGWGSEGVALGEHGLVEWSVLDAQWFGLAQRRRRVFAVLDTGAWASRPPVLLERDSLRGDTAPSRQAGQSAAHTLAARTRGGGGLGTDFDCGGGLIADISPTLLAGGNRTGGERPPGTNVDTADTLIPVVARALTTSNQRIDAETETPLIAHTLRGDGFDASEDGTGRGTPLVPVVFDTTQITSAENGSNPKPGDPCHPLAAGAHPPAIAFPANLSGTQCASSENLSPSLCAANPTAVAHPYTLAIRGRGDSHALEYRQDGTANALLTPNGGRGGIGVGAIAADMQVRLLTPVECERLQGFPDNYTRIPSWSGWRQVDETETPEQCIAQGMRVRQSKKTGKWRVNDPDGPRYRALGNSMAVPVMRWIGERIAQVEAIPTHHTSERSLERAAA